MAVHGMRQWRSPWLSATCVCHCSALLAAMTAHGRRMRCAETATPVSDPARACLAAGMATQSARLRERSRHEAAVTEPSATHLLL